MDHAQLTSADYAQIAADRARRETHELSLKIDGLADILGFLPEDLIARGQLAAAKAKLIKEEKERKRKEEEEAEIQASGLSREEWDTKRTRDALMRVSKLVDAVDLEESRYTFNYATGMLDKMLGVKK